MTIRLPRWRNVTTFAGLLVILMTQGLQPRCFSAELFFDSFDGPTTELVPRGDVGNRSIERGSYVIRPRTNQMMFSKIDMLHLADYSIETQVRAVGEGAKSAVFVLLGRDEPHTVGNNYFGGMTGTGFAFVGESLNGDIILQDTHNVSFNPVTSDVMLRTDFFGDRFSFYAWPVGSAVPKVLLASYSTDGRIKRGSSILEFNPNSNMLPSAEFRFARVSRLELNPLDLNFDGSVNVNDLDSICFRIGRDPIGSFSDFLKLSSNFGSVDAVWEAGDFDGDGTVQFSDFLILASSLGASRQLAARQ